MGGVGVSAIVCLHQGKIVLIVNENGSEVNVTREGRFRHFLPHPNLSGVKES